MLFREVHVSIQAYSPTSLSFLSEDPLQNLATHYKIPLKPEELMVAKDFIKRKLEKVKGKHVSGVKDPDIATVFHMLDEDMFPTLKAVFQVDLTISISSCSCERSFSALRRRHMAKELLLNIMLMINFNTFFVSYFLISAYT